MLRCPKSFSVLLAIMLLSGCSWFSREPVDLACPAIGFVSRADTVSLPNADVVMNGYKGSCDFKKQEGSVVELEIPFIAKKKDPAAQIGSVEVSYFLAVLSPDEAVLQRQAFSTSISFDPDNLGRQTEEHTVKIPVMTPSDAYKYKIAIGFSLTPEQRQYNLENHLSKKDSK